MDSISDKVISDKRLLNVNVKFPLVSVIVTNYNYEIYLKDCLNSIYNQDYENYECIIVDDKSTDNSIDVINEYVNNEKIPTKLICHDLNKGQFKAFQTGLAQSKGAFIIFVDADDILLINFISEHLKIHLGDIPVAFTSSNQYQINEKGEIIAGTHSNYQCFNENIIVRSQPLKYPFWPWATTSTMMFRKPVIEAIIMESVCSLKVCADNYLCHFANLIGDSIIIPEIYGCYRRHEKNNFASNPYIGNRYPIGNMDTHPDHQFIKEQIRQELISKNNVFLKLLSFNGYLRVLLRVTDNKNLINTLRHLIIITNKNSFIVVLMSLKIYISQNSRLLFRILTRNNFTYIARIDDYYPKIE